MNLKDYKKIINERAKIPLYYQVELLIENFLENEKINAGESFFSEMEVAEQLGVSRPTVNRAFKSLIEKGILTKNRGKRSIVKEVKNIPLVFMSELSSYGEMLKEQGLRYKTVLLKREKIKPTPKLIKALNLRDFEEVVYLKRLRYIEEEPIIIVDSYLAYPKYSELLEIPESSFSKDLYKLLKDLFNIYVIRSEREVTATNMSLEDSNLLEEEIWNPCLRLVAIAFSGDNEPCEFFDSRLKGQKCILKSSLNRINK